MLIPGDSELAALAGHMGLTTGADAPQIAAELAERFGAVSPSILSQADV